VRVLKEALAGHSKEFPGPLGSVIVECDEPPLVERIGEPFPAVGHSLRPLPSRGRRRQRRHAVYFSVKKVDGVGAFVDHNASWTVAEPAAVDDPRP
jgi:hypothetical protein